VPAELIREAIATGRVLHGRIPDGGRDSASRFAIVVPVRVGRLTTGLLWAAFREPPTALDRTLDRAGEFGAVMAACMRGAASDQIPEAASRSDDGGCLSGPEILRALSSEIARCERHRRPLSVCVIGLNGSSAAGLDGAAPARERTLAAVGRGLQACLRPYDAVGRLGRDEFLVVMPETPRPGADAAVRHLREAVQEARRSGAAQPDVAAGIAEWGGGKGAMDLLADAHRDLRAR